MSWQAQARRAIRVTQRTHAQRDLQVPHLRFFVTIGLEYKTWDSGFWYFVFGFWIWDLRIWVSMFSSGGIFSWKTQTEHIFFSYYGLSRGCSARNPTESGSLFSEYLWPFREKYIEPLFVSPGEALLCCHCRKNKLVRRFQICTGVPSKQTAYRSEISRSKLILKTLEYINYFPNCFPGETATDVGRLWKNSWWVVKKSVTNSQVSQVNNACKMLKPLFPET